MRLFTPENYPTELKIKDCVYQVRFPKRMPAARLDGFCDCAKKIIYVREALPLTAKWSTFIHEVLHALAYEHNIDMTHDAVYGLEHAISDLLLVNF